MDEQRTVMVATLGGQPQVVTFALDALLDRGVAVDTVYLLHLSPRNPRYSHALRKLLAEWQDGVYRARNHPCRLERVPIADHRGRVLADIRDETDTQHVLRGVRDLLRGLKETQAGVHLCLTGGRRMIALLALSTAALLFDHRDRVWHLYTPDPVAEEAREGRRMHVGPEEGVRLLPVPLVPWGEYFPGLRSLLDDGVLGPYLRGVSAVDRARCQAVLSRLTARQQDVLRAFAQGLTPQEVASRLVISLHTVHTHKTAILAECRAEWGLDEDVRLDYRFLHDQFGPFLREREGAGP